MRGFVIKAVAGDFTVYCQETNQIYTCKARGQIRNKNLSPICGDEVIFENDEKAGFSIIMDILDRKNELIRPIVSNIDIALIVMSTIQPEFDSYLVDKLLVLTRTQNIEPIIVVSKCEFLNDSLKSLLDNYKLAGYEVIEVSSHQNINIQKLLQKLIGKKVVLCGQSAVGKSSLVNAMMEIEHRSVGGYSEKLGRGRHQTREVEFMNINGAYVADSPGFSRLDIHMDLKDYARAFKDFDRLANNCKFNTCLHDNEPGCAIKEAVNQGIIDQRRYTNYLHLKNEIKDGKHVWKKK